MTEDEKKKLEARKNFAPVNSKQFIYTHLRRKRKKKNEEEQQ